MITQFNKLTPTKEVHKDFFKMKWKPIKNFTYNLYITDAFWIHRYLWVRMLGFSYINTSKETHAAWWADGFILEIGLYFFSFEFWINYNFICHKEGERGEDMPLDFRNSKTKTPSKNPSNA